MSKIEVEIQGKRYWYHQQHEKALAEWNKKYPLTPNEAWPKPGELYECGKMDTPEEKAKDALKEVLEKNMIEEMRKIQEKKDELHLRTQAIIAKGGRPIGKPILFGTAGHVDETSADQLKKLFFNPERPNPPFSNHSLFLDMADSPIRNQLGLGRGNFKWNEMPEPRYKQYDNRTTVDINTIPSDWDVDKVMKYLKERGIMVFKEKDSFSQRNGYKYGDYDRKMLLLL